MTRSQFLRLVAAGFAIAPFVQARSAAANPDSRISNPGSYDFLFTRLMYESGDWDVDQRMPSNLIDVVDRVHHLAG